MTRQWIRIAAMVMAIVATIILNVTPGTAASTEWVSLIATFILAAWNAWKNNDFTSAAKVGTEVMHAIKDGKITEEEVKEILGSVDKE